VTPEAAEHLDKAYEALSKARGLLDVMHYRCGGVFAADGGGEEGTLERLTALRRELVDPKIAEHRGCIPGSGPGT